MGKKDQFEFDATSIIKFILKNLKLLIAVSLIAFVVSAVVSFMIKPKFKSTVIVFPSSTASISKSVMNMNYLPFNKADLLNFGDEDDCDQLTQVLMSAEIKDMMNKKFNLMAHYGIDSVKTAYPKEKYYNAFEDNFRFQRTEYKSIKISVLDIDKELAAKMANDVVAYADSLIWRMRKSRGQKAYDLAQFEYARFDSITKTTTDSMNKLTKLGLYDYKVLSKDLNKAYYSALLKGKTDLANKIKQRMDLSAKYGIAYDELNLKLIYNVEQRSAMFYKVQEIKAELEQALPSKFIVESARVSEKKAYPRKSLIVLASTVSTFFLTLILLIFVDTVKKYF